MGPRLSVERTSVAVGESVEVRGQYFGTACNDTISGDSGLPDHPLGDPDAHIQLRVVQNGLSIPLARLGANRDYKFAVRVTVPGGMHPGAAAIEATTSEFGVAGPVAIDIHPGGTPPVDEPPATVRVGTAFGSQQDSPPNDRRAWIVWGAVIVIVAVAGGFVIRYRSRAVSRD